VPIVRPARKVFFVERMEGEVLYALTLPVDNLLLEIGSYKSALLEVKEAGVLRLLESPNPGTVSIKGHLNLPPASRSFS